WIRIGIQHLINRHWQEFGGMVKRKIVLFIDLFLLVQSRKKFSNVKVLNFSYHHVLLILWMMLKDFSVVIT
ncbi:hypothetical protein B9K06_26810, partial [Bacillus sp. OG2]